MKDIQSFNDFKKELISNTDVQKQFQADPVNAIQQFQEKNPLDTDPWIYRIVVLSMGLTVLIIIIGVIALVGNGKIGDDKSVPTIFTAIGSAAIGALAGLLAPSPKSAR